MGMRMGAIAPDLTHPGQHVPLAAAEE
jgi:hypothetical protein